jgi:hypothetical protein
MEMINSLSLRYCGITAPVIALSYSGKNAYRFDYNDIDFLFSFMLPLFNSLPFQTRKLVDFQ